MDGLIGGIVTRAGPVTDADFAPADQEALARLKLRPVFVGIERDLIRAAIDAQPQAVRTRLTQTITGLTSFMREQSKLCPAGIAKLGRPTSAKVAISPDVAPISPRSLLVSVLLVVRSGPSCKVVRG